MSRTYVRSPGRPRDEEMRRHILEVLERSAGRPMTYSSIARELGKLFGHTYRTPQAAKRSIYHFVSSLVADGRLRREGRGWTTSRPISDEGFQAYVLGGIADRLVPRLETLLESSPAVTGWDFTEGLLNVVIRGRFEADYGLRRFADSLRTAGVREIRVIRVVPTLPCASVPDMSV